MGVEFLTSLDNDKRAEIIELVKTQKKAKISWIATITQVSEDAIIDAAEKMDLLIEDDYILIPSESKKHKVSDTVLAKREQIIEEIISNRYYSYNPGVMAASVIDNVQSFFDGFIITDLIARSVLNKAKDEVQKRLYNIVTFDGNVVTVRYSDAMRIIESMKNEFRRIPDEMLRLHITIKKYFEFLVLPKIKDLLSFDELNKLRLQIEIEDNRVQNLAIQAAQNSIIDQTMKRKKITSVTFLTPNGTPEVVEPNRIELFIKQLINLYQFEFRKQFYEQQNFLTELTNQQAKMTEK
ncbi:MAG: hypothetical protein FK734_00755 [Asgard group archaeon]|nr:hypothetical protein [Asgard group archaeon]